jgi:hypothetical protein
MRTISSRDRAQPSLGVVYLCFGEVYLQLTALSISQLRRCGYAGPIRILTNARSFDFRDRSCEVLRVPSVGTGFATRHYKTQINKFAFDTTLLLDADAIPIAAIGHIWRELRFADVCMSLDLHPDIRDLVMKSEKGRERRIPEYSYMNELGLMEHPFYSSGVMLFRRNAATDELFELWHEEWNRFQDEDQLALVRALARTNCRVHTLAPRWNARLSRFGSVEDAQLSGVRILHLRPASEPVPSALLEAYA